MIPTLKLPLSRTMECIDLTITDTNSNKLHPKLSSKIPIVIIESDTESENESDDSDIEFVDDGPASSTNPRSFKSSASRGIPDNFGATTLRPVKAATNCERVERLDGAGSSNHFNATSISEDERIARELQEEERRLKEAGPSGHLHTATTREDERLARELQAQDRKEYRDLISGIVNKKEGIVFRTVINVADETLEDGSPAHPDDLERFEPWKKLFETTSLGKKVKRFHWIVNYELEKRFEEAKEALQTIPGIDPPSKELLVFHGTNPSNIDSILDNGFRIGGVGGQRVVNGTALGYGVYLATQSATSVGYALGGNRIFACRVFPGKITSDRGYSMNPPKTTNPLDEPYQTFMQGGVYVVRYAALLLPCYMIEFESTLSYPYYGYNLGMPLLGAGAFNALAGAGALGTLPTAPGSLPGAKRVTKTRTTRRPKPTAGSGAGGGAVKGKGKGKADALGTAAPVAGAVTRAQRRKIEGTA